MPIFIVSMILFNTYEGGAQSTLGNISIEKGGQIWIEGDAGIVNYKCNAEQLSGMGAIENTQNPQATVEGHGKVTISVTLPVKSLDCGKKAMNQDMYEALKSERFPTIQYRLLDAELADKEQETRADWMNIRTRGIMQIAGVADTTTINVLGKLLSDHRFQVRGSKSIHMDTYNIKPPSAMFGLIRADKELSVHFDVTVRLDGPAR